MLPFGSILTQIPLIIIGALYMLYLGLCAVNRSKEEPVAYKSEVRDYNINVAPVNNTVNFFSVKVHQKEKGNSAGKIVSDEYLNFSLAEIIVDIGDQDIETDYTVFSLFSRPPPSSC